MSNGIGILIVDDHPVVRDGLRGMLGSQPDFRILGEAGDGAEAERLAESLQPDVVLMDLRMPQVDGATATGRIRARWPHIHVLVLTTYDSDADILRAIEAGATGYILKDAGREELFQAVRASAAGFSYLSPLVASRLVGRVRSPAPGGLSEREGEVLAQVARGASNKDVAHRLHISEATVKSHLLHIFAKLEVSDRTEAVTLALQRGLIKLDGDLSPH